MQRPFPEQSVQHNAPRTRIPPALPEIRQPLFPLEVPGLSRGNLSVQAQKLEAAGYLRTTKGFRGRIPVTSFTITTEGKKALGAYHAQMRALIPKAEKK